VTSNTWLQRLLVTIVLAVTAGGLEFLGLLWLLPWAEACVPRSPPAQVAQVTSPFLSNLAPKPAPATSAPSRGPAPPRDVHVREVQKMVLAAQSIDGPAMWVRPPAATTGSSAGRIGGVLAWTDTGQYHRLHIMTSPDGLHYDRDLLLPANAIARPSVTVAPVRDAEVVILAWTGIDPGHRLNVMYDALGRQHVLTLPQGSPYAPSLALFGGRLWLVWTGLESSHALHIRALALDGQGVVAGAETILGEYRSLAAPSLAPDALQHQLLLTWAAKADSPWLSLAASPDGTHWHLPPATLPTQASSVGSTIMALPSPQPQLPAYAWAWSGTDRWHPIRLALALEMQDWSAPVTTLTEWCLGQPALGYVGSAHQILLAWTGIDPRHTLTIAVMQVDTSDIGSPHG
jgi:hypothetical protein